MSGRGFVNARPRTQRDHVARRERVIAGGGVPRKPGHHERQVAERMTAARFAHDVAIATQERELRRPVERAAPANAGADHECTMQAMIGETLQWRCSLEVLVPRIDDFDRHDEFVDRRVERGTIAVECIALERRAQTKSDFALDQDAIEGSLRKTRGSREQRTGRKWRRVRRSGPTRCADLPSRRPRGEQGGGVRDRTLHGVRIVVAARYRQTGDSDGCPPPARIDQRVTKRRQIVEILRRHAAAASVHTNYGQLPGTFASIAFPSPPLSSCGLNFTLASEKTSETVSIASLPLRDEPDATDDTRTSFSVMTR